MKKRVEEKDKINFNLVSYTFGILSIIFGIFSPLIGLVVGIVGLNLNKKEKSVFSKKARKLNIIGIIVSIVVMILSIIAAFILKSNPLLQNTFPVA